MQGSSIGPLFVATPDGSRLDEIATGVFRGTPDDIARLGFAVANRLNQATARVDDMDEDLFHLADEVAMALKSARRPLVVSGTGCGSQAVLQAAANVAWSLHTFSPSAGIFLVAPECNSVGAGLLSDQDLGQAVSRVTEGQADTVIILENDIHRRLDARSAGRLFDSARRVIAIDHLQNDTTRRAQVVLPAASFAENTSTMVSSEGRAQRAYRALVAGHEVRESWRWLRDLLLAVRPVPADLLKGPERICETLAGEFPVFAPMCELVQTRDRKIPRQSHRHSGRMAMNAHLDVHEPQPPQDDDSPLAFSMEGDSGVPSPHLVSRYWKPGWNSVQALNRYHEWVGEPASGRRLFEPVRARQQMFFTDIPGAFRPESGNWLAVPLHHVFGSDELSGLASGIAELAPPPYLAMNPEDAGSLGIKEGDFVDVTLGGDAYRLPVRMNAYLLRGVSGLPSGLAWLSRMERPMWIQVVPA
jgi:NADH-quinone oxidoreductase subunit G